MSRWLKVVFFRSLYVLSALVSTVVLMPLGILSLPLTYPLFGLTIPVMMEGLMKAEDWIGNGLQRNGGGKKLEV
jgi:hypothetical protein